MSLTQSHKCEYLLPSWAKVFRSKADFIIISGGRASGKSWSAAASVLLLAHEKPLRVAICREHRNAIDESFRQLLCDSIKRLGLKEYYTIRRGSLEHHNGSHIFFIGLSQVTKESVKGLEAADLVLLDEAQAIGALAWELLKNTVRKAGSQIWCLINPTRPHDAIYRDFILSRNPRAVHRHVTYLDNPFFPERAERDRCDDLNLWPERYAHIWLGAPDGGDVSKLLLPGAWVKRLKEAWALTKDLRGDMLRMHSKQAGLDLAAEGQAQSAYILRQGPVVQVARVWHGMPLNKTAKQVLGQLNVDGPAAMYYDVGGVGSAFYSLLERPPEGTSLRPILFGAPPEGGEVHLTRQVTNQQFFSRRNAQMGWGLRLRLQNTLRWLDGDDVELSDCLLINPSILCWDSLIGQMTQPEWFENETGKLVLTKAPKGAPSPDLFDALCLAFASDSRQGLRANRLATKTRKKNVA